MHFNSVKSQILYPDKMTKNLSQNLTIYKQLLGAIFVNLLNNFRATSKFWLFIKDKMYMLAGIMTALSSRENHFLKFCETTAWTCRYKSIIKKSTCPRLGRFLTYFRPSILLSCIKNLRMKNNHFANAPKFESMVVTSLMFLWKFYGFMVGMIYVEFQAMR